MPVPFSSCMTPLVRTLGVAIGVWLVLAVPRRLGWSVVRNASVV